MILKNHAKSEEKLTRIWSILTLALAILKVCPLTGSFRAKYITFDLKDYTGVILHDTEEWEENWRKTDLWFEKWHEKCGKVLSEHLKVSKLGLWWDPFLVENAWAKN